MKQVNTSFAKVPEYSGSFADYNDDTEGDYNKRIVSEKLIEDTIEDLKNLGKKGARIQDDTYFRISILKPNKLEEYCGD